MPSHLATKKVEAEIKRASVEPAADARERLAQLYRDYARFVAWFASRMLTRQDEVEDVVQEVFVIAATQLDGLNDPPQIRGWMKTVTLRRITYRMRWQRVRSRFGLSGITAQHEQSVAAPDASPEDRAALQELLAALEKMPTGLRVAWSLRYMHEETLESIAELCGCSLATAKRRIVAAQARLRTELE